MPPLFREVIVKVNITHSNVKRNSVIYYVTANDQFSEEEKAVIRARSLGNHTFTFQTGLLNVSPYAFTNAPLGLIRLASRILAIFAVIFLFAMDYIKNPLPFLIFAIGSFALFLYRRRADKALEKAQTRQELKVKDIVTAPFSICTDDTTKLPAIEQEITDTLRTLKGFITLTAEAPVARTVEI